MEPNTDQRNASPSSFLRVEDQVPTPSPRIRRKQQRPTPMRVAPSVPKTSNVRTSTPVTKQQLYPTTLNPFGDDDEENEETAATSKGRSTENGVKDLYPDQLNPFGEDDEEEEEEIQGKTIQSHESKYDDSLNPFGDEEEGEGQESLPSMTSSTASHSSPPTPRPRMSVNREKREQMERQSKQDEEQILRQSIRSTASSSSVRPKSLRGSCRPSLPPPPVPSSTSSLTSPSGSINGSNCSTPTPKKKTVAPLPPKPPKIHSDLQRNELPSKTNNLNATKVNNDNQDSSHALVVDNIETVNEGKVPNDHTTSSSSSGSRRDSKDAGVEEFLESIAFQRNESSAKIITHQETSSFSHSLGSDADSLSTTDTRPESSTPSCPREEQESLNSLPQEEGHSLEVICRPSRKKRPAPSPPKAIRRTVVGSLDEIHAEISCIGDRLLQIQAEVSQLEQELINNALFGSVVAKSVDDGHSEAIESSSMDMTRSPDEELYRKQLIYQYLSLAKETCTLARKQEELMYQKREHKLEEQHADLEYDIRQIELIPPFKRSPEDDEKIQELIHRLIEVIDQRNDVVENMTKINKRPDFDKIVVKLKDKLQTKQDIEAVDSVLVQFLHENDMEVIETQVMNMSVNDEDERKGKMDKIKEKKSKKKYKEGKHKKKDLSPGKDKSNESTGGPSKKSKSKSAVKSLKKFATLTRTSKSPVMTTNEASPSK